MNPLAVPKDKLGDNSPIPLEILKDDPAVIHRFADDLMSVMCASAASVSPATSPLTIHPSLVRLFHWRLLRNCRHELFAYHAKHD